MAACAKCGSEYHLTDEHDDCVRRLDKALAGRRPGNAPAESPPVVVLTMDTDNDQAWPLRDVLSKLAGAGEHLLLDHGCDQHGHEETRQAVIRAREILASDLADPARKPAPVVPVGAVDGFVPLMVSPRCGVCSADLDIASTAFAPVGKGLPHEGCCPACLRASEAALRAALVP